MAAGQFGCAGPALVANYRHQLLGALTGQTIVSSAETSAGAFAMMLEADAPIGALDASPILLDTDWPEEIKLPFGEIELAVVYAIIGIHVMPRYDRPCEASTSESPINTGCLCRLYQAMPSHAKAPEGGQAVRAPTKGSWVDPSQVKRETVFHALSGCAP